MEPAPGKNVLLWHLLKFYEEINAVGTFQSESEREKWWSELEQLKWQHAQEDHLDARTNEMMDKVEYLLIQTPLQTAASHSHAIHVVDERDKYSRSSAGSSSDWNWRSALDELVQEEEAEEERKRRTRQTSRGNLSHFIRSASQSTFRRLSRVSNHDSDAISDSHIRESGSQPLEHSSILHSSNLGIPVPNALISVANYFGLSMEKPILCLICMENVPISTVVTLTVCSHQFCATCLREYLEFKINEGQVYTRCFYEIAGEKPVICGAPISEDDLRAIVSENAWNKYTKFKFNKENEFARQCPYCNHSQLCLGSDHPDCVCEACKRSFCFLHSNAHDGGSCADYEKRTKATDKLNRALIDQISKPCPGCSCPVEKIGGCNQMKCIVCNTSFCWLCNAAIDDSVFPEHFQWWNIRGCAGNQMSDPHQQTKVQRILRGLLWSVFFVVFAPPALLLTLVFCVICCGFAPCTIITNTTRRQMFTTCLCISGYVLLSPVLLVAGIVGLAILLGALAGCLAVVVAVGPFVYLLIWLGKRIQRRRNKTSNTTDTNDVNTNDIENGAIKSPSTEATFLAAIG